MRHHRAVLPLIIASLLLGGFLVPAPTAGAPQAEACFAETNQCLRGRFLEYWLANGGLAINGYPLSAERRELLEDGREYTVQYFERVRLELHPENAAPHDVLLGQFGRRVLRGQYDPSSYQATVAPAAPVAGQVYFPQTGHNLGGSFRRYWEAHGGLAQFGYPLTEERRERLEDGNEYTVQYFERARFEYHPGEDPDVLLGQFGRRILPESDALAGDRGFALLYLTDERVQGLLGAAVGTLPVSTAPGLYQGFERGAMVRRGDTRRIYVLCGGERSGRHILGPSAKRVIFTDTWQPGDDPGGGPGPAPDLYLPRFGFGKLWREDAEVRECLGYAITPEETAYTLRAQFFVRGELVSATTPGGRFLYVLYRAAPDGSFYERYPDPSR